MHMLHAGYYSFHRKIVYNDVVDITLTKVVVISRIFAAVRPVPVVI